ncbi:MAG: RagB/SusD family nutrient uptake outer membrane protein [Ferruginibacter sp.]
MKYKILSIIALLTAIIFVGGCKKDLLNKFPKDAPNAANFFVNSDNARAAALGGFSGLKEENWFYKRYFITKIDNMSDDSYTRPAGNRTEEVKWTFDATYYGMRSWYRGFFSAISHSNFAIDGIPTSTDPSFSPELQAPYIAVAKLVKGFCYLQMTTLWGDVPYFPHSLSDPKEAFIARTPKAEVLLALIEDLKYAAEHLPASWTGADLGLPTKAAGAAMLAKAYLYAKDYANAETAAKNALDIADAAGYRLMDDYVYMMSEKSQDDGANKEFILTLNFTKDADATGDYNEMMVERNVRDAPGPINDIYGGGWGYALPTRNLYDAFETTPKLDPRRKYSIWAPGDFYGIYHGVPFDDGGKTFHDGDSIFYKEGWSLTNLSTRKLVSSWMDNGKPLVLMGATTESGYDDPLLRYADLVLYYGEALIENGKIAEGMAQVNRVRARPSVNLDPLTATGQDDARKKLRHERRVELNMEGVRLFDLFRWGAMEETFGVGLNAKPILMRYNDNTLLKEQNMSFPKNNLWPIHISELDANPLAKQNPGW